MSERKVINLYEHYKNAPKKLKIVCDWDEVIQGTEPYSLWLTIRARNEANRPFGIKYKELGFATFFKIFWDRKEEDWWEMDYSPHGSRIKINHQKAPNEYLPYALNNPTDFYRQAPFLTIAEDLLKLIKEDKIERLVFLSTGDNRKYEVFGETFGKFWINASNDRIKGRGQKRLCDLRLLSEEIKTQGTRTKSEWIKKNVPDFDIFIDDNPYICKDVLNEFISFRLCRDCRKERQKDCASCSKEEFSTVCSPYYPAIENQHDERVLLIKQEVSDLKKEDFK